LLVVSASCDLAKAIIRKMYRSLLLLTICLTLITSPILAQKASLKEFEKIVLKSSEPLIVEGERVYRGSELTDRAIVTFKPEPMFTEKARRKKTHGLVEFFVSFSASGEVKVLSVRKRLPNGLTEEALKAAGRIQFKPALLDGKPVSQIILLRYSFNRS
jgi:Gram-negative bacterial TonB protein C-terminal